MRIDLDRELARKLEYLAARGCHADDAEGIVRSMIEDAYRAERKREDRTTKRNQSRALEAEREAVRKSARGFPISTRLVNTLINHDIWDFKVLVANYTEADIMKWKDVGKKTLRELRAVLADLNLRLRIV